MARSAGTYAQFIGRDGGYAQLRLSSGEVRVVRQEEQEHQVEEIRYVSHLPSTKVVHF